MYAGGVVGRIGMKTDPILNEVYRMKDQLAREVGRDAGKLCALLRESAKQHPERMVNPLLQEGKRHVRRSKLGNG